MVRKSISLTNAPSLSESEAGERASDWTEFLFKSVPFDFLQEAFSRAAQNNNSGFPVSAYEIRAAYVEIENAEKERKRLNFEQNMREIEEARNMPNYEPCEMCFDCGFTQVTRHPNGFPYKGVIKCYSCNYWQRYKEKHGL